MSTLVDWDAVFADTPRSSYVPAVVWGSDDALIDRDTDPEAWAEAVAADIPLVTQMDDGMPGGSLIPTSSASQPSLVRHMLEQLDVEPDHDVLEIGTGTGWSTALLATALTAGRVTSIEVDPLVAIQAQESLRGCGSEPTLIVGDGLHGYKEGAPYDRIAATMAVQRVPYAWVEQVRPGGVILTPWGTAFHNSGLLRLVVAADGTASGRFVGNVNFMWARSQRPRFEARRFVGDVIADPSAGRVRHTTTDPRPLQEEHADFAIGLRLPDVEQRTFFGRGAHAGEFTTWYADGQSWASVDYVPDAHSFEVNEGGPRDLWREIEDAYAAWRARGEPPRGARRHGDGRRPAGVARRAAWSRELRAVEPREGSVEDGGTAPSLEAARRRGRSDPGVGYGAAVGSIPKTTIRVAPRKLRSPRGSSAATSHRPSGDQAIAPTQVDS